MQPVQITIIIEPIKIIPYNTEKLKVQIHINKHIDKY